MMASDDPGGMAEWPTFELVTPDMPPDIPVAARERLSAGVPKALVGSYDAAERATLLAKTSLVPAYHPGHARPGVFGRGPPTATPA
jgi:hypothetical protein